MLKELQNHSELPASILKTFLSDADAFKRTSELGLPTKGAIFTSHGTRLIERTQMMAGKE